MRQWCLLRLKALIITVIKALIDLRFEAFGPLLFLKNVFFFIFRSKEQLTRYGKGKCGKSGKSKPSN